MDFPREKNLLHEIKAKKSDVGSTRKGNHLCMVLFLLKNEIPL